MKLLRRLLLAWLIGHALEAFVTLEWPLYAELMIAVVLLVGSEIEHP